MVKRAQARYYAKADNLEARRQRSRVYTREYVKRNAALVKAKAKDARIRRFFYERARDLRRKYKGQVTPQELWSLWKQQRGRCAITGRRLMPREPAQVHLDHIIPRRNGGESVLGNLRWVCEQANMAKSKFSDVEFVRLCEDVVMHRMTLGVRMEETDAVRQ